MNLDLNTKIKAAQQVAYREIAGKTVLIKSPLSTLHHLNKIGSFIWSHLDEEIAIKELAEKVVESFDVQYEIALNDVLEFVENLSDKELVVVKNEQ